MKKKKIICAECNLEIRDLVFATAEAREYEKDGKTLVSKIVMRIHYHCVPNNIRRTLGGAQLIPNPERGQS